jgi:uncharacterized membrane protein YphA (DoxX/SURF4 family)
MIPSATRYASTLGVFRILAGLWWLIHGYSKLTSPTWGGPNGACASIIQDMASHSSGPYHDFLLNFVLPHVTTFALLISTGETLTGVSLVLGLFTALGGAAGVFLVLNYWIAGSGFSHLGGYSGLEAAVGVMSGVNAALPTGLVYGLDGMLAKRKKPAG